MVEFHTGYDVDENDYRDTKALCECFNIPLPKEYEKFDKNNKNYIFETGEHK